MESKCDQRSIVRTGKIERHPRAGIRHDVPALLEFSRHLPELIDFQIWDYVFFEDRIEVAVIASLDGQRSQCEAHG